jgi:hypothetical protein
MPAEGCLRLLQILVKRRKTLEFAAANLNWGNIPQGLKPLTVAAFAALLKAVP